jgi:hypothetical protein
MTWWQWLGLFTLVSPLLLWSCFWMLFSFWAEMTGDRKPKSLPYYVVGVIGIALDLFVNAIWGTALFAQRPNVNRLLLSARMDDLIVNGSGWRQWLAVQIVGRLLEPFDKTIPKQHTTHGKQI